MRDRDGPSGEAGSVAEHRGEYTARGPNGLRFVAQVRERALICEAQHHILVLDRERADASIRYDALKEAAERGTLGIPVPLVA